MTSTALSSYQTVGTVGRQVFAHAVVVDRRESWMVRSSRVIQAYFAAKAFLILGGMGVAIFAGSLIGNL